MIDAVLVHPVGSDRTLNIQLLVDTGADTWPR